MKYQIPFFKKIVLSIFVLCNFIACKTDTTNQSNSANINQPVNFKTSVENEVKILSAYTDRDWSKVEEKDYNFSSEGGQLKNYYQNGRLRKITAASYGEMGKIETTYYLDENGQLIFIEEEQQQYNRPISYDSLSMIDNNDNEFFDDSKTDIILIKAYFDKDKIVQMEHNKIVEISDYQMEDETKRFMENFTEIKTLN